eukprot:m.151048 g.151048  ORF g.151048 m.151048 type:complete len:123 (+) comp38563_c0_seq8:324-692(+)
MCVAAILTSSAVFLVNASAQKAQPEPANPPCFVCSGGETRIKSMVDMKRVCYDVDKAGIKMKVQVSENAGSYLCDFVYYTSLHMKISPTVFIHVPNVTSQEGLELLARSLECIISAIIEQMK